MLFDLKIFSGGVYSLTHNLFFLFPLVFGNNLFHFFDFFDEKKNSAARNSIVCFAVSIPWHPPFDSANCFEECNVFGNGKCELNAIKLP